MNAEDIRKLTEQARSYHQDWEEAKWLAHGIAAVEHGIQNAAKNERGFYRENYKTCPDFVVEHFEALGFEVKVVPNNNMHGTLELTIRWE